MLCFRCLLFPFFLLPLTAQQMLHPQLNGPELIEDLYDETHWLLYGGGIGGLKMKSKTQNLGMRTYYDPRYEYAGPIDCFYVTGPNIKCDAERSHLRFQLFPGHDHLSRIKLI